MGYDGGSFLPGLQSSVTKFREHLPIMIRTPYLDDFINEQ